LGSTGEILKFDVGNAEETQKVLTEWQENNPNAVVEVIVNNAGITRDGLFMWMPSEDWNNVINTSLNGFSM
jgi:3-oxoacyl-[acyl-carrier protein] reductase